ncbi:MAG: DUF11 domain-containing protein [Salinibacterium sp.]|nr:hypothetical protein [Salinibacterium sp.]MBF0673308.1 DUF11 domain-containing protein [Salinibacterium sp.]
MITAMMAFALAAGGLFVPQRAAAAMTPFPTGAAMVYVGQDSPTRLYAATATGTDLVFSPIGPTTTITYNALAYNVNDNYLYATRTGNPALIRISSDGSWEVVSTLAAGAIVGAFGDGANSNRFYYLAGNQLRWYNVANGNTGATNLQGTFSPVDMAWSGGYFWGLDATTATPRMFRLGLGGVVTTYPFPGLDTSRFGGGVSSPSFGGAWTYGNGNLGFTNNAGGTVQVSISDPASATPSFTAVSYMSGPASGNNDAAASPGTPVDLAIAKTVDAPTKEIGDTVSYSLTVTNTTTDAISSGFTIRDAVPTYLTIDPASVPAHCSLTGQLISCAEGTLEPQDSLTRTFQAVVNSNASRGLAVTNTATVLGNEEDTNASNNSASAAFTVVAPSLALVKTADYVDANDNGNPDVGETVTWSFRVTNNGDIDATGVSIDDPTVTGITPAAADIDAGDSATFTATGLVTQAHVDASLISNTATATGTMAGDPYTTTPSTAELPVRAFPALQAIKSHALDDANANGVADVDEEITYTVTVTNTGNVTMSDVSVDDPLVPGLTPASATLAPGESQAFTGVYVVTPADVTSGSIINVATAEGTTPGGQVVESPPTRTTQETVRTGIELVKSAVAPNVAATSVGQEIEYRFVVTNTGNTALEAVEIDDPMLDAPVTVASIPAGGQVELIGVHTVTQADLDATAADGFFTNTATASGTPQGGGTPIVSDPSSVNVPTNAAPLLELEKEFTLNDLNGNGLADVGETIDYAVTAINAGNVTLYNVEVVDAMFAPSVRSIGTLVPGQARTVDYTGYEVTQADVDRGSVPNTATGSAEYPSGTPITPPTPVDVTTPTGGEPLLHAVKRAVLADANGNGVADVGETIQYTVEVWNRGTVSAANVQILDAKPGVSGFTPGGVSIAPGDSVTFGADPYVVTAADVDAGAVINTAHANGRDPRNMDVVRSNDSTTSTPTPAPQLAIVKLASLNDANGNALAEVGETIDYTFLVSNNGNVTIDGISVTDARVTGLSPSNFALAPGAVVSVSADPYVVTDADVLAGSVVNSATASGTPTGGAAITTPPSTTTTTTVTAEASLALVKVADHADTNNDGFADLGETITYSFEVTNTGSVTVTGVTITDPRVTGVTPAAQDVAPGQTVTFTSAAYTVVQADIDAGEVSNSATANGTPPGGLPLTPPTDQVTVPSTPAAPALTATKTASLNDANGNLVADEGEAIEYTVTLTNTGNITLDNVFPSDPLVAGFTPATAVTLAPGQSQSFVSTPYAVTGADVDAGVVRNTATGSGTPPAGSTVTSPPSTVDTPTFDPGMLLTKTAALADTNGNSMADVGEVVTFTFTVTNTGNVVLENVAIDDPTLPGITPATATIAVGASAVFTGSYVVTDADIAAGEISNTATSTGSPVGGSSVLRTPPSTATVPPAPLAPAADSDLPATGVTGIERHLAFGLGATGFGLLLLFAVLSLKRRRSEV